MQEREGVAFGNCSCLRKTTGWLMGRSSWLLSLSGYEGNALRAFEHFNNLENLALGECNPKRIFKCVFWKHWKL